MMKNKAKRNNFSLFTFHFSLKSGQVMIMGIVVLVVVLILAASLFGRTSTFIGFGAKSVLNEQATQVAEAGLNYAVQKLNDTTGAYLSQPGSTETQTLSTGQVVIKIDTKSQNLKTITATGYISNSTTPRSKRTVKADVLIDTQQVSFKYAVQVGENGLSMKNSSQINGTVYVNGNITGSGSSVINGEAWAVGSITSPDPTITVLPPHPSASPAPMPIEGINTFYTEWKTKAEAGGETICPGGNCSYSGTDTDSIGPRKLVGNLTLSNFAELTLTGPIWVTGNVTVQNSTQIKLDQGFGSNGTVLIADGKVSTANSGAFTPTSASPKGYILVVTTSTLNDAIKIANSGVNAIFYALDGGADLENTAKVTALVAKRLELENSASLTYDSGLANAQFTSGPGGSWQIKKGTYRQTSSP